MNRRSFVQAVAAAAGVPAFAGSGLLPAPGFAQAPATPPADAPPAEAPPPDGGPHSFERVVALARQRAGEAHEPPSAGLLPPFDDLSPADYAAISPDPAARIDLGGAPQVAVEPLPPGSVFETPVRLARVSDDGRVDPIEFSTRFFRFDPEHFDPAPPAEPPAGAEAAPPPPAPDEPESGAMGFSGFRLVAPIDRPDMLDPVAVFQGASQFRARPRDGVLGASARGLAIATASATGEEVPVFTRFWLHSTGEGGRAVRVHALLEGPSVTGAYAFEIQPGAETVMTVRCRLFPRTEITQVGIAPLTSMFFFGPDGRQAVDDVREAVHDSDGLQIVTGRGERIWRPLSNPPGLQLSGFVDDNPSGFGLVQRARSYGHYEDPRAGFERRPSVWVEPLGEWGRGQIVLVEIPLPNEVNDNIVAFWRPSESLQAGGEYAFDYAVTFAPLPPDGAPLARVVATRSGAAGEDRRRFAVEFDRSAAPPGPLEARLSSSHGSLSNVAILDTPVPDRLRVEFRFAPEGAEIADLRLFLAAADGTPASETWLHRWIGL